MTGGRIGMRVVVLFLLLGIRFRCRVKWVLFIGGHFMHIFSIPKIKLMLVQFQTLISQIKLHQTLIVTVRHQNSSQPFLCTVNKSLFHCVSCVVLLLCLIKEGNCFCATTRYFNKMKPTVFSTKKSNLRKSIKVHG